MDRINLSDQMKHVSLATPLFLIMLIAFPACRQNSSHHPSFAGIENGFRNIPDSVQTSVYWYWISDHISADGVVKDLEAMKKAGINRAFIGNIGLPDLPAGKVRIFSDEWWSIMHIALKTAGGLGIDIGIFNSPGWSQSGGPWIKPEQSMRYLNSSEINVKGPDQINMKLSAPSPDFQRVRVIAYKAPAGFYMKYRDQKPVISSEKKLSNPEYIMDGDTSTSVMIDPDSTVVFDFDTPSAFTVRSLLIYCAKMPVKADAAFYYRKDNLYRKIRTFEIDRSNPGLIVGFDPYAPVVISLPETASDGFRLVIKGGRPSGAITEVEITSVPKIERYPEKSLAKMFQTPQPLWNDYMWPVQPEYSDNEMAIDPSGVIDLSGNITPDGMLKWSVPEGDWVIMQTGMTSTGVVNEPSSPEGTGLEADKMSKEHITWHFDSYLGEILRRIPAEDRRSWKVVVEDSYERGGQNWTDTFIEDFRERYGYDPMPYVPALRGHVVGSRGVSDRFLWDLRRLVADKVAYDYVGGLREISHRNGLTTWLENYGHWGFPAEFLQYGGQSDEVGGEFWSEGDLGSIENRAASSCAHIYGKRKVSAESFTCAGAPFSRYPATMKKRGDRFFTEGINNTLLHVYIHQPEEIPPGVNAWFGNEFNRHNTWFNYLDLFTSYLKRSNFMLQQGTYVADLAYFIGEDAPKMTGICSPAVPPGYSFDYINSEVIMKRMSVSNGKLVLPDGMSYRILVLPRLKSMRPELLKKIESLVKQGAVVVGPAPDHSPSLQDYPECDEVVRKLANSLWGDVDGVKIKSAKRGKGMIISTLQMKDALDLIKLVPDCNTGNGVPVLFIHRKLKDGDIYFLTNQSDSTVNFSPEFRVTGKLPELWDATSGALRDLSEYVSGKETTVVPLQLGPSESAFIVFRKDAEGNPKTNKKNYPSPRVIARITGPWQVTFDHSMRGPVNPVEFRTLSDWTINNNDSIKYYSGSAVYRSSFIMPEDKKQSKVSLGTGEIHGMARIRINGQSAGGVWTFPWTTDISGVVKTGENLIEIEVVNTWVNRLIGDAHLPSGKRATKCFVNPYTAGSLLQPSGLTGPVVVFFDEK